MSQKVKDVSLRTHMFEQQYQIELPENEGETYTVTVTSYEMIMLYRNKHNFWKYIYDDMTEKDFFNRYKDNFKEDFILYLQGKAWERNILW